MTTDTALFPLGKIVSTPAALQVLEQAGVDPLELIHRHVSGDWGTLDPEDEAENRFSVTLCLIMHIMFTAKVHRRCAATMHR